MDLNTFLSALLGGFFTLVGAFGAIYFTELLDRRKQAKNKYMEKLEEIGAYLPQLYRWHEEELNICWDENDEKFTLQSGANKYDCPYYEIENLVQWWAPSLNKEVQQIYSIVSNFEFMRSKDGWQYYTYGVSGTTLDDDIRKNNELFKKSYNRIRESIGKEASKLIRDRKRA